MATSTAFSAVDFSRSRDTSMSRTPSATFSSASQTQTQTIDLTAEDDDDDEDMDEVDTSAVDERHMKRQRIGPEPGMFATQAHNHQPFTPSFAHPPQTQSPRERYRSQFVSNPAAFFPGRQPSAQSPSAFTHPSASTPNLHHPRPQPPPKAKSRRGHVRQVIDLTSSPSPPPLPTPNQHHAHMQHMQHHPQHPQHPQHPHLQQPGTLHHPQLPQEVPPRTPVCIGQLTVTALVLYPIPYLNHRGAGASHDPNFTHDSDEFASVRLRYDPVAKERSPTGEETIHILTPQTKVGEGPEEKTYGGDNFGVVEQKVATVLGPMLGKGLIRVDAKIRRGMPNLPILPLHLLLFTPKGNIPIVSTYLHNSALMLDHPAPPFDLNQTRMQGILYSNPHNPPPGGFGRSGAFARAGCAPGMPGRGGGAWGGARWTSAAVNGKSVEVQRSQVDEVFKSLKSGDDLEETEATFDIQTTLYPHQKKALTFLLERECEVSGPKRDATATVPQPLPSRWGDGAGSSSSLWQVRKDPSGRIVSWMHAVTNREVYSEPRECKAALLADDMGLGKTITCVSLIANTLPAARAFGSEPLDPPPRPPLAHTNSEPALTASHFQGAVWNMPEGSGKGKGKGKLEERKEVEDYTRACRLKVKSRGTLIVCPLSTVVNWEDQFKEHWAGEVVVFGGNSGPCAAATNRQKKSGTTGIRVYVYHGNARSPDPAFLADFDAVITTYATLASEFSKQSRSGGGAEEDDDDESDGLAEVDEYGHPMFVNGQGPAKKGKSKGTKRKKGGGPEQSSPLQMVHWFRVVLDEAHSIKETSTVGSRASCDLAADRRLCLTGTPVQNKLDDVYALIKFLRLEPFDDKAVWTEYVGGPVKFGQPLGVARLQTIMKCITLRRTKETRASDGTAILSLPPRRDELRYLKFDEKEQQIYNGFFDESKAEFNQMSENNEVMKNYVGILQKILRLRQICDHFELVKGKGILADEADVAVNYDDLVAEIARDGITVQRGMAIFNLMRESGTAQCVECGYELAPAVDSIKEEGVDDESGPKRGRKPKASVPNSRVPTRQNSPAASRPVLTRCQHLFCIECFRNCILPGWPKVPDDLRRCCSTCQAGLSPTDAVELNPEAPQTVPDAKKRPAKREKRQRGMPLENLYFSTKVKALLTDLTEFSKANPNSRNYDPESVEVQMVDEQGNSVNEGGVKTVVFSQWTSMLDKIEDALETAGIRFDRLDGTMKRDDRTRAMDALKYDPGCEVLLVSLKAGGVGLNLTAAQRVYLMDPYWNPAVENQAVDRIHRLGQTKPVTTVKLIIENSIEARLLEVQKRKTALANMTLSQNISKADLMQRRMEELNQLFGTT